MKQFPSLRAGLVGLLGLAVVADAATPDAPAPASVGPPATTAMTAAEPGFRPGLSDLMTMLVQPRHNKLFAAGTAANWELAASQARDLRGAFGRISQYLPKYLGVDLREATGSFLDPQLDALDAAIAAGDPERFIDTYRGLTGACNACHAYLEHGYLVIKVPSASVAAQYPDQDFSAVP